MLIKITSFRINQNKKKKSAHFGQKYRIKKIYKTSIIHLIYKKRDNFKLICSIHASILNNI